MRYFFILGRTPTLSIAELSSVFNLNKNEKFTGCLTSSNVFIVETDEKIDAKKIINRLGGIIKVGILNKETKNLNIENIKNEITDSIKTDDIQGKFKFGISYYGKRKFNIKPLAMETKKYLKEKGISCRWVTCKGNAQTLSSVIVKQNRLVDGGAEIVLIEDNNKILIGQTITVQPFKELSFRDYGRPARDDRSGMIPPKLAQIMINLSQAKQDEIILDPFCGSGTILTEAMLIGYDNLVGADISEKAISDTEKNVQWIIDNYQLRITNYELFNKNAAGLSKFIKGKSVDAVVTEPYLGPQRGKIDVKKTVQELEQLYSKSLIEFKKILKPDGRIVMIFPVFTNNNFQNRLINPNLNGFKIINPIPKNLRNNKIIKLTDRKTIIYGRPGQKVWREIVILLHC